MTRRITCSNCETTYRTSEAKSITINGPETAWYVCPKCHRGTEAAPPQQPIGTDLPGIDHIEHTREKAETLATCWFTNDARLHFREIDEGWLREEVVFPDGEYEDCTLSTLRRNWPHIAAVVLDT